MSMYALMVGKKPGEVGDNENDEFDDDNELKPIKKFKELDFTMDDDIYEKTGVKRPRRGEELDGMEAEKLYRYQLEQDIQKIIDFRGTYQNKVQEHNELRNRDSSYRVMNDPHPLGMTGNMNEVSLIMREESWRSTSKLKPEIYGTHLLKAPEIAAKRYREWLHGKPKGPSKEFLKDKAQRKLDSELWEDIKHYRFDKTRTELREESIKRAKDRAAAKIKEKELLKKLNKKQKSGGGVSEEELQEQLRTKRKNIHDNNFVLNRSLPTEDQAKKSMRNWDKAHQENWDFDKDAFGKYVHLVTDMKGERMSLAFLGNEATTIYEGPKFDFDNFIKEGDEIGEEFKAYVVETNLKKAEYFVSVQKRKRKLEAKREAKRKRKDELVRRRRNLMDQAQLACDAIVAKTAVKLGGDLSKSKKNKKKPGDESEDSEESEDETQPDSVSQTTLLTPEPSGEVVGKPTAQMNLEKKKVPTCTDKLLVNIHWFWKNCTHKNIRKEYKAFSRKYRRKWSRVKTYFSEDNREKLIKDIKQLRCILGKPKKKKAAINPEGSSVTIEDSDFTEVEAEKTLREWEKYTEEEIDAMDSDIKKRLKKMRKADLEKDAEKERRKQQAQMQKKIEEAKKEKDMMRKKKLGFFSRVWAKIYEAFSGEKADNSLSSVERRKKEAEAAAKKTLQEEENFQNQMESLFSFRERQRQANKVYEDLQRYFLCGVGSKTSGAEYNVDELIRYARLGMYTEVMDITDHLLNPIHPNDTNSDGESAFYTVLKMVMNNEAAENAESDLEIRTCMQSIKKMLSNRIKAGKLDLVLKILYYKGGNVNFVKNDRDIDGTAILHEAAASGSVNLIGWVEKRGADFSIRTSNLKRTPLMFAARAGQANSLLYLLKKGSMLTLNAQDANGWTALHFAAAFAHPDVASILMICGADTYARSVRGTQPVDEAATRGRQTMVETIRAFKQPDLLSRRLFDYFEIRYLHKAKEVVPDAEDSDEDEDENLNDEELLNEAEAEAEAEAEIKAQTQEEKED